MTKHIRKECECCGVEEDLHIRSSNSIYDIKSGTIRLEMTYLCTKCKEITMRIKKEGLFPRTECKELKKENKQ